MPVYQAVWSEDDLRAMEKGSEEARDRIAGNAEFSEKLRKHAEAIRARYA
jgi:hypothetical protein